MKNILSRVKGNVRNKITNIKNGAQKFSLNFSEAKSKPRSKRKSFFLGVTTVIGIFGLTLLAPVLSAVAKDVPKDVAKDVPKDVPKKIPTPGEVCPAPPPQSALASSHQKSALVSSHQIINAFSGTAATICALAVSSGSFMIGAVCGVIVVIGILKAQGR